jgi:hypothetical protein
MEEVVSNEHNNNQKMDKLISQLKIEIELDKMIQQKELSIL